MGMESACNLGMLLQEYVQKRVSPRFSHRRTLHCWQGCEHRRKRGSTSGTTKWPGPSAAAS
eukprot:scaffold249713_cov28-Tisochrysis_lutea.AAC.1